MNIIVINNEPVELYKILKFEGLASSGGQAKSLVAEGKVLLNGTVELRKRKKIISEDIITFAGEKYSIILKKA